MENSSKTFVGERRLSPLCNAHASCFSGCLAEHRRVTTRRQTKTKAVRKEKREGKNGRKECWWILNAEAQTFLLADSLWIQRYYTYSRCISYASYRRAEKLDETLFACNDREIHCFDKRRLDFSLVESIDAFASPLV